VERGSGGGANTAREKANERTHMGGEREQEMGGDDAPKNKTMQEGAANKGR